MNPTLQSINGCFFARSRATGFGLMRMAWAALALLTFVSQSKDIAFFYGDNGVLTTDLAQTLLRHDFHFTILSYVHSQQALSVVYGLFTASLCLMFIGVVPRLSTIISVLLFFSFDERNPFVLGGGDTLLRTIGFLLMIAPGIDAFSFRRLRLQLTEFKKNRSLLPAVMMSAWPYRLLLWQLIVLYGTSFWYKLLGTLWLNGTAVQIALHHPIFLRFPVSSMNVLMSIAPLINYLTLIFEGLWILLLIPQWFTYLLPPQLPRIPLKRILLLSGMFFHGAIFILMDAGSFSLAIFTAYFGLLREEDIEWLRNQVNKKFQITTHYSLPTTHSVAILYDGNCGLCLRTISILLQCDWLQHLQPIDFRNAAERKNAAPDVSEQTLDKALHIKIPSGEYRTGFDAFRSISWHLPPLWPLAPLLYIPGVSPIGRLIYANIANRRKQCTHEECRI